MRAVSPRIRLGTTEGLDERPRYANFRSIAVPVGHLADYRAVPTDCLIS
jgi:hypothetical protein